MKLKLKVLNPDAVTPLPSYATDGSACFDIATVSETTSIPPGGAVTFATGIAVEMEPGWALVVHSRSGHGFKYDTRLANSAGIIDSDYRGEIFVRLRNDGDQPLTIKQFDRIAQGMVVACPQVTFEVVSELNTTQRGTGGLGSTGTGMLVAENGYAPPDHL